MTKPEFLMRNSFIYLFIYPLCSLPLEQQQKCYPEDICALPFTAGWILPGSLLAMFLLHSLNF